MTKTSTWFRVALLSIVLVTCDVVPPSVVFARDSEISAFSPTASLGSCPAFKSLTINKEKQKTDTWCGVATAKIAMDYVFYRGVAPEQCEVVSPIASGEPSDPQCPTPAPPTLNCCDESYSYNCHCMKNRWPEEIFNSRGFSYLDPYLVPQSPIHAPLTWNEVIDELCDEDRPYISTISTIFPGGGTNKHSVIVHGYLWIRLERNPFTPVSFLRAVQVYDPYDNLSYWDWERFINSLTPFLNINTLYGYPYEHDGDTYKIRKIRWPFFNSTITTDDLPLLPGER